MRPIVVVRNLSKRYILPKRQNTNPTLREAIADRLVSPLRPVRRNPASKEILSVLRDVSFEAKPGEVIGIIGRNGAGKSTLLKILAQITKPSAGEVDIYGRVGSLLEIGTGFHPDLTGRENVYLNATILGMKRREIKRKFDEIVAFSEVEQFLDMPVKFYSSGMYLRLAFSIAAHLEPEVLLLDEVLAVGDVTFQQKCITKMKEVSSEGRTVFFVSHSIPAIQHLCNRVFLIRDGLLIETEDKESAIAKYLEDDSYAGDNFTAETKHQPRLTEQAIAVGSRSRKESGSRILAQRDTAIEVNDSAQSQRLAIQERAVEALKREVAERDLLVQSLSTELDEKEAQLLAIANTVGGLLSIRLLLPLYGYYRRIRYPYLLWVLRFLGLMARPQKAIAAEFILPEIKALPPLQRHDSSTDIIVCVHDALEDVRYCLESLVSYTTKPYSLILVDDGSSEACAEYLDSFASSYQATLIRNEKAKGYTLAANQGLRQSRGEYVLLLNSDTVVTEGWLDRMIACAESDPCIGLVGPLSNAATWQSIPEIITKGEFAENKLSGGLTIADMGKRVVRYSARLYPSVRFLNGFCLMMKRAVIERVGYFDEEAFGRGYGEENDYVLRAQDAGWRLAIADDTYVYHAQSRSYSHERRKELCDYAARALTKKHGQRIVDRGVTECRHDRVLQGIRARSQVMTLREDFIEKGRALGEGRRVLFVLPSSGVGGGSNVILDEAEAMEKMGLDVTILNLTYNKSGFEEGYPDNSLPVIYVKKQNEIPGLLPNYDAVIATWHTSVEWMSSPGAGARVPVRAYYVQDFEPQFFLEGSVQYQDAWDSYTRYPDLTLITKTDWNRAIVKDRIGVDCAVVGPSVNIDLHRPRSSRNSELTQEPLRIAAMIRPNSARRAGKLTMEVLRKLDRLLGDQIEIILFGCDSADLGILSESNQFAYRSAGILTRPQLASLLDVIDIFVDFSTWQAMGLTAMEAMCHGVAVIVPRRGGADTFVTHEKNGLIVDSSSKDACVSALNRLLLDAELRTRLQRNAVVDICKFFREQAAFNILRALFSK